ncbi:MAG: histidine phosphatase family protein [Planctomycetes bacterium]|nr:histidine phosphatase family protein [Planctomycetota bacterium]
MTRVSDGTASGHEHRVGRRLWFVRHGDTTGGSSQRYFGATDVPLSDLGREQVGKLAPLARGWRPRALLHSPLSRAAESARIVLALLAERPGAIEVIDALREGPRGRVPGRGDEGGLPRPRRRRPRTRAEAPP